VKDGGMIGGTTGRNRLPGMGVLAVAGIALLVAGCGSSSSPSSASGGLPSLQTLTAQALSFAKCMRSHGISDFPDPTVHDSATSKGVGFALTPGSIDTSSPLYKSANKVCTKQTGFGHITAAQLQQGMSALLKFAECMRSHGVTNFPDPVENGQNIGFNFSPADHNSPRFKAAQSACGPLLPGGGP
jgi:hypothetical protein